MIIATVYAGDNFLFRFLTSPIHYNVTERVNNNIEIVLNFSFQARLLFFACLEKYFDIENR